MKVLLAAFAASLVMLSAIGAQAEVVSGTHEAALAGATKLRININGDVHVLSDPGSKTVRVIARPADAHYSLTATRTGDRLTLTIVGPQRDVLPFSGPSGSQFEVVYPATLPLDLREYSGSINLEKPIAPVDIYIAAGNLHVASPQASVTAETNAGNILIQDARSAVDVASDAGNIFAELAPTWIGESVRMQAANGNMQLMVSQSFRGNFDVSTEKGSVKNALHSDAHGVPVFMFARSGDIAITVSSGP